MAREEEGEERKRKREKRKKIREKGRKNEVKNYSKNFACDTHLKFTKGKRIQLKNIFWGERNQALVRI